MGDKRHSGAFHLPVDNLPEVYHQENRHVRNLREVIFDKL
jgi:hypothetical protein